MGNEESKRGSERSSYRRGGRKDADYDEEAHKLFRLLNLDAGAGTTSRWNNLDVIYQHPTSGGKVYVGNISAAGSLEELTRNGVRRVVNCQDPSSECVHGRGTSLPRRTRGTPSVPPVPASRPRLAVP